MVILCLEAQRKGMVINMTTNRYKIFVGLSDQDKRVQEYATERFNKIIQNICKGYRVAFSTSPLTGGYFYEDGEFTTENSICVTLIGIDDAVADEIAKDAGAFFNQESVMVLKDEVECRFISDKI